MKLQEKIKEAALKFAETILNQKEEVKADKDLKPVIEPAKTLDVKIQELVVGQPVSDGDHEIDGQKVVITEGLVESITPVEKPSIEVEEVKPKVKPEVKPEIKAEVKAEVKNETKIEASEQIDVKKLKEDIFLKLDEISKKVPSSGLIQAPSVEKTEPFKPLSNVDIAIRNVTKK